MATQVVCPRHHARRLSLAAVLLTAAFTACSSGTRPEPSSMARTAPPDAAPNEPAHDRHPTIALRTEPDPPQPGSNRFEITVTEPGGSPINDADVSLLLVMPSMPEMKMPEMRNAVALASSRDGKYTGSGTVPMAGTWEVTMTVKQNGKEIGLQKSSLSVKESTPDRKGAH